MTGDTPKSFPPIAPPELHAVAPRLARFTDEVLFGDAWERPGLSPRDKSFVTCAALIATDRAQHLEFHARRALDNGLTPRELGELVTHLGFYCGLPAGLAAAKVLAPIHAERGITAADVAPSGRPELVPPEEFEVARKARIAAGAAAVAPALAAYTEAHVFGDLWRNPDLSLRDRALATVIAFTSMGIAEKGGTYLGRAFDGGLTETEFGDAMTQLAFYAGWPKVMTAMVFFRAQLDARRAKA